MGNLGPGPIAYGIRKLNGFKGRAYQEYKDQGKKKDGEKINIEFFM
jgi:hypothetical protein